MLELVQCNLRRGFRKQVVNMAISRSMIVLAAVLMTTALVFGQGSDSSPPERGECKYRAVAKSFSLQDPQNNTCTFTVPHWRCDGLCHTEALPSTKKVEYNPAMNVYKLPEKMDVHCKCCQPDPSRVTKVELKSIHCDEGYKWTGEPIPFNLVWGCECLSCESFSRLPSSS